jgi:hypothetical protein
VDISSNLSIDFARPSEAGNWLRFSQRSGALGQRSGQVPPRWDSLLTPSWLRFEYDAGVVYWSGSRSSGQRSIQRKTLLS